MIYFILEQFNLEEFPGTNPHSFLTWDFTWWFVLVSIVIFPEIWGYKYHKEKSRIVNKDFPQFLELCNLKSFLIP